MPVYNGERFVGQAIESVLNQSCADFELILVDDASTDSTAQIIETYLGDDRLKYILIAHAGVTGALNVGLNKASGRYIARLDADDAMATPRLARQLTYLEDHSEVAGVGSYYHVIDERGVVVGTHQPRPTSIRQLHQHLGLGGKLILPHPTMMLRKSVMLQHGGYRPAFEKSEDVDLFLRIVRGGDPLIILPEYLTFFRVHGGSVSAKSARRQYLLNELIHVNYHRYTDGLPDLSENDFVSARSQAAWWRRVLWGAAQESAVLKRRHDDLKFSKKAGMARAALLAAAFLDPVTSWNKVRRLVGRSSRWEGVTTEAGSHVALSPPPG